MPLITKNLSKRSRLKNEKQKLIDRINQCKSMSEIEGWKKTFIYHDVLKNDEDWDEDFFFSLIEFKLRRMRDYFWNHNIVENESRYGDICDKLIDILKAGYKTNIVTVKDLYMKVNDRNINRFLSKKEIELYKKPNLSAYWLPRVREAKAKALFWRYLEHHIEELWD